MFRYGEKFFLALGFAPLPRRSGSDSLFVQPQDRDVVCHASAWRHRRRGRPPHQDVHQCHRRGLRHHPPRARAQLLSAGLQPPLAPLSRQRQRRLPRGHRRYRGALDDPALSERARAHRRPSLRPRRTSVSSCRWRSTRWRSCRSVSSSINGGGRCSRERRRPRALQLGRGGSSGRSTRVSRRRLARSETDFDPGAKYHVAASVPYSRYFIAAFSSSSFTARSVKSSDTRVLSIAAPFTRQGGRGEARSDAEDRDVPTLARSARKR